MTTIVVSSLTYFDIVLYDNITAKTYDTALLEWNKNVSCLLISPCHMVGMSYNYISKDHCDHIMAGVEINLFPYWSVGLVVQKLN